MKHVYFLGAVCLFASCNLISGKKKVFDYCYVNSKGLYAVANGKEPTRIFVNGTEPRLSPDGRKIAYTDIGGKGHERRIGVFDLEAGKVTIMDTACHNCYGPVWSPDGNYLVYNAFTGKNWSIRYIDKENQHVVELATPTDSLLGFSSPTWSWDGKKIVVQNMSAVCIYGLDGRVLQSVPFEQLDTSVSFSSSTSFVLNKKEDKLVYWAGIGEELKGEPHTAVFVHDLGAGKSMRVSPKGYECWQPTLKGDTIYCNGKKGASGKESVYRMDLDGGHFTVALKNKVDVSFASR
jgi:dipeptidyl aminopeptidase/acylaminoacyl peptidase